MEGNINIFEVPRLNIQWDWKEALRYVHVFAVVERFCVLINIYIYIYIYIYKTLRSDCRIRVCILQPLYQSFLANVVMESSGCAQRMTETVNFGLILISVMVCGLRESLVN